MDSEETQEEPGRQQMPSMWTNRTLCSILSDMRKALKTLNFALFPMLIEELQIGADRMEAALEDQKDINKLREARANLKDEVRQLIEERDVLLKLLED